MNSRRAKFDSLSFIIDTKIGLLLISQNKPDDSFLPNQFRLKEFCNPYRLDRNSKRVGFYYTFVKIFYQDF